jgi:hypothetical protein
VVDEFARKFSWRPDPDATTKGEEVMALGFDAMDFLKSR